MRGPFLAIAGIFLISGQTEVAGVFLAFSAVFD